VGLKNFGMNYGVLFTAWGVGGFVLSRLQAMLFVASKDAAGKGSYQSSFITAGILLMVGAALTFLIKSPTAQAKTSELSRAVLKPSLPPALASCSMAASRQSRFQWAASARRVCHRLAHTDASASRKANGSRVRQFLTSSMPATRPTCRMSPTFGSDQRVCNSSCNHFCNRVRWRTD